VIKSASLLASRSDERPCWCSRREPVAKIGGRPAAIGSQTDRLGTERRETKVKEPPGNIGDHSARDAPRNTVELSLVQLTSGCKDQPLYYREHGRRNPVKEASSTYENRLLLRPVHGNYGQTMPIRGRCAFQCSWRGLGRNTALQQGGIDADPVLRSVDSRHLSRAVSLRQKRDRHTRVSCSC